LNELSLERARIERERVQLLQAFRSVLEALLTLVFDQVGDVSSDRGASYAVLQRISTHESWKSPAARGRFPPMARWRPIILYTTACWARASAWFANLCVQATEDDAQKTASGVSLARREAIESARN
jgi:hypothetical protein